MTVPPGDWVIEPAVDVARACSVLSADRIANAYALSDREPPYDRYTTVAIAGRAGAAEAACLIVRHPDFTGIVTHGDRDGLHAILTGIDLPTTLHVDLPDTHRAIVERFYTLDQPHSRQLMAVDAGTFRPVFGRASRPDPPRS